MHGYHDEHGHFPPAVVYGKKGQALLSWRVLLLPYLEKQDLYARFRLDEPWDSPHNRELLAAMPALYRMKGDTSLDETYYQVFTGPGSIFDSKERVSLEKIVKADGSSLTFLVVEAGEAIPWTKPADLVVAADRPLPLLGAALKNPFRFPGWNDRKEGRFRALYADGTVRTVRKDLDERTLRALVTWNGNEDIIPP